MLQNQSYQLDQDNEDIVVLDKTNTEVRRFQGDDALEAALDWIEFQGVTVISTLSRDDLIALHRLYPMRLMRRLRKLAPRRRPRRPSNPFRYTPNTFPFSSDDDDSDNDSYDDDEDDPFEELFITTPRENEDE